MKYVRNIFNICDNNIFQIKNFCGIILVEHLVDSTVGALCELNTTKPSMEIRDKNPTPTIEKKVQEDSHIIEENKAKASECRRNHHAGQKQNDQQQGNFLFGSIRFRFL